MPSQVVDNFAVRLQALMAARGLSLTQVERMTGIDRALVSKYRLGKTRPRPTNTARLAAGLGVSLDELLLSAPREEQAA